MKTFREILDEELEIGSENNPTKLDSYIERAAIRFANQQTAELQALILSYRNSLWSEAEAESYDKHFGITTQRYGRV